MVQTTETRPAKAALRAAPPSESRGFTVRWRNPERGVADFAAALWACRFRILCVVGVCTLIGFVHVLRKPNSYTSQSTLMVSGNTSMRSATDAAANLLGTGTITPSQVLTAVEVVRSKVVLRSVVERVGYEEVLRPYQPIRVGMAADAGMFDAVMDAVHEFQARWLMPKPPDYSRYSEDALIGVAVQALGERLGVEPSSRGTTISLSYTHTSPSGAAKILSALVDESIRRYGNVVSPPEGQDWLDTKVVEAEQAEIRARSLLRAFSERHGSTDLSQEITTLGATQATLIGNLRVAEMKRQENEQVLESLREEFAKPSARSSGSHYAALELGIRTREIELIALRTQIPLYEETLDETRKTLEAKRQLQREVEEVHAELTEATTQHKRLRELAKTFEINSELDVRGLTNLRVVEPADVPRVKAGPYRGRLLLAFVGASLALCISWVVLRTRLNRRMMAGRDVTFALGRSDVVSTPLLTEGNLQRFEDARRRGWE